MALSTYVPVRGPAAGSTYTVPTEQTRKRGLDGADDSSQPARLQGKHYGAGVGTPFFAGGTADSTFQITPGFAEGRGFTTIAGFPSDMAKTETALSEFFQYVVQGGLGTLTDVPPTGYKLLGNDGVLHACSQRVCTARVVPGSVSIEWQDGGTIVLVTVTLENPVGYWSCNLGGAGVVFVPFH